jgi:hypothetical protein
MADLKKQRDDHVIAILSEKSRLRLADISTILLVYRGTSTLINLIRRLDTIKLNFLS